MHRRSLTLAAGSLCCFVCGAAASSHAADPAPPAASQPTTASSTQPASVPSVRVVSVRQQLAKAIAHYQRSEFEQARELLTELARYVGKDRTREAQQVQLYLAFTLVAFGKTEAAVTAFERALEANPHLTLSGQPSPKLARALAQARERYRAKSAALDHDPPRLRHAPLEGSRPHGRGIQLEVQVSDPAGVARVTLNYRTAGERGFATLNMERQPRERFVASIPRVAVVRPAVEYYLAAWDKLGNGPGLKGSLSAPIRVAVTGGPAAAKAAERPWYRKWWVWALVGGAVATRGGVTAGVLLGRQESSRLDIRIDPNLDPLGGRR